LLASFFVLGGERGREKDLTQRAQRSERRGHGDGEVGDLAVLDEMYVPWYICTIVEGRNYD